MAPRFFARLVSAACLMLFSGCLSPTLPLPPPEPPDTITAEATPGTWLISGNCLKGAMVTVFDEDLGKGAVVEDRDLDGRYEVVIQANLCDLGWVEQRVGTDEAARTTFVIQDRTPSGPLDPLACK